MGPKVSSKREKATIEGKVGEGCFYYQPNNDQEYSLHRSMFLKKPDF